MMGVLVLVLTIVAATALAGWTLAVVRLRRVRSRAVQPPPYADGRPVHALAEESAKFGVWELDPAAYVVHLSAGAARLSVTIPSQPELAGLDVTLQAAVPNAPGAVAAWPMSCGLHLVIGR